MTIAIGAGLGSYAADIGLRLRRGIERYRELGVDLPGVSERSVEGRHDTADCRSMAGALRFADDQEAVERAGASMSGV
jgi:hypothetical protein